MPPSPPVIDVRSDFSPAGVYLDTATFGLPPTRAVEALRAAVEAWADGSASIADYDEAVARSRDSFAALVGADPSWVATGATVSPFVATVAASLPGGSRVLCAEGDFTSVLFPFLAHSDREITVMTVPWEGLVDSIDDSVDLVAASHVQSADGRVLDLAGLRSASRTHGAATLIDVTQSCGWAPIDASGFDFVVGGGYKWLLSPRGTSFMSVRPSAPPLRPILANWYAGEDPWESVYGPPLRLATDARRFDTSPAWLNWVATAEALDYLRHIGVDAIGAHNRGLAAMAAAELGVADPGSAILRLPRGTDARILADRGIRAAVRDGALRVAFHLYNIPDDVTALVDALRS